MPGGFQVWWRLALLRMGEQWAARSRGEQGGHRGLGNQGERGDCRATESWRVHESGEGKKFHVTFLRNKKQLAVIITNTIIL